MSQRSRSSGSQSSHWTDRLIATCVGLGVGLGIAAGTIGVAKLLAPNNDSDAGAVRDVIVLRPRQSIQFLNPYGENRYSLSICTNSSSDPRAAPRDAGSCSDFHNVNGETRVFKLKEVSPDANNPSNGIDLGTIESMAARMEAYNRYIKTQQR
jgi:hypothetical protein